jgi:undecaprenyl-diphosphatase
VRAAAYASAAGLIGLIAAAQMYVGAQWLSIGLFAIVIGSVWVVLLGIGYRLHGAEAVPGRRFLLPVLGVFLLAATANWSVGFHDRLAALTPSPAPRVTDTASWQSEGYAHLAAFRLDMADVAKQPLNVQWVGPLEQIDAALVLQGWQKPEPFGWAAILQWLARSPIADLPVVPQVHAGHYQALVLHKPIDERRQWLLRLWPTVWHVDGQPLWLGNVTQQEARLLFGMMRIPVTVSDYTAPMQSLAPAPEGFEERRAQRSAESGAAHWNGETWLLSPKAGKP